MSINLYGEFVDKKGRTVCELSFNQTPTQLTYKIVPEDSDRLIIKNYDHFIKVLKPYFDYNNCMVAKPFDTKEEKINEIKQIRLDDYNYFIKDEMPKEEAKKLSQIDEPINIKPILGKYWQDQDYEHIKSLIEIFKEYSDDYTCILYAS